MISTEQTDRITWTANLLMYLLAYKKLHQLVCLPLADLAALYFLSLHPYTLLSLLSIPGPLIVPHLTHTACTDSLLMASCTFIQAV